MLNGKANNNCIFKYTPILYRKRDFFHFEIPTRDNMKKTNN